MKIAEYTERDSSSLRSLNFAENYIKEVTQNTNKWAKTNLLEGIEDPFVMRQCARLLENQRIQNESEGDIAWKRVSIPAIRRVYGSNIPWELVSIQALNSHEDRLYYSDLDERQNSLIVQARTRNIGSNWWNSPSESLSAEAEALGEFSQRYREDMTKEIIRDLTNNAGSKAREEYKDTESLMVLIEGMSAYIAAKIKGREATWLVVSPIMAEILKPYTNEGLLKDKWKLYENNSQEDGKILLGHKNRNHYLSGYFFCPYRPFTLQIEENNNYLYSRYGKKLLNANFYGLLDVANLPKKETNGI